MSEEFMSFFGPFLAGGAFGLVLTFFALQMVKQRPESKWALWGLVLAFLGATVTCLAWSLVLVGEEYLSRKFHSPVRWFIRD